MNGPLQYHTAASRCHCSLKNCWPCYCLHSSALWIGKVPFLDCLFSLSRVFGFLYVFSLLFWFLRWVKYSSIGWPGSCSVAWAGLYSEQPCISPPRAGIRVWTITPGQLVLLRAVMSRVCLSQSFHSPTEYLGFKPILAVTSKVPLEILVFVRGIHFQILWVDSLLFHVLHSHLL